MNSVKFIGTVLCALIVTISPALSEPSQSDSSPVDHSIISYHVGKMARQIRANINAALCPQNSELILELKLTEQGNLSDIPKYIQRSNNSDCDDAVIRGIYAAKPFSMPHDHPKELKLMQEPLLIKFRPRSSV